MTSSDSNRGKNDSTIITFSILVSRLILFLLFQSIIALIFNSWEASQKYWLATATLTNIVTIILLYHLFKRDGNNYFHIFKISKETIKKDLPVFLILTIVSAIVVFLTDILLTTAIWGDTEAPAKMMFGPIERWLVYTLMILFPVTIAFAELANYFVYLMPKLKKSLKTKWLAILFPVLFLSLQHCTLPFIPDLKFILYRALVFLPFALIIGLALNKRPTLFIYFAVLHGIMDFGTALMFLL